MAQERRLVKKLSEWYRQNGRDLPWRGTRNPYEIWVSEILLQQTQVRRVGEFYERFLKKFPNLDLLAASQWRSLLPVWRGLGYYSRGKNMLSAAKIVRDRFNGRFPDTYEELIALPGIGPYTANALLAFAFDKRVAAIDTNLQRVIGRLYGGEADVAERAHALFRSTRRSARELNYALMDLGSSVCRSRIVHCVQCPLKSYCAFYGSGKEIAPARHNTRNKTKKSKSKGVIEVGVACIHRDGRYLIAKRPRAKGGAWEFPGGKRESGEDIRGCIKRELREELGIEVAVRPHFFKVDSEQKGAHYRLYFCRCQILRGNPKRNEHEKLAWVSPGEFERYRLADSNLPALSKLRPPSERE